MEKIKNWFRKPIFTFVSYFLALLLLGYAFFTVNSSYTYIAGLVAQGQVSWMSDIKDIISYFIANSINYFFYAFSFVFFGKVIAIISPKPIKEAVIEIADNEEESDEIEELVEIEA